MACRDHTLKRCLELRVLQITAGKIQLGTAKVDVLPKAFVSGACLVDRPLGRRAGVLDLDAALPIVRGLFFCKLGLRSRQSGPGRFHVELEWLLVHHGEHLALLESVAHIGTNLLHQARHFEAETRVIDRFHRSGELAHLTGGALGDQYGLDGPNPLDGLGDFPTARADEEDHERKTDRTTHRYIPCMFR